MLQMQISTHSLDTHAQVSSINTVRASQSRAKLNHIQSVDINQLSQYLSTYITRAYPFCSNRVSYSNRILGSSWPLCQCERWVSGKDVFHMRGIINKEWMLGLGDDEVGSKEEAQIGVSTIARQWTLVLVGWVGSRRVKQKRKSVFMYFVDGPLITDSATIIMVAYHIPYTHFVF